MMQDVGEVPLSLGGNWMMRLGYSSVRFPCSYADGITCVRDLYLILSSIIITDRMKMAAGSSALCMLSVLFLHLHVNAISLS